MKKMVLLFCLFFSLVFGAHYESDPQRITAGEPFTFSLVVDHRELPKNHKFPSIGFPKEFQLLKKDTVDEMQQGFMFRRSKVRKFRYHFLVKNSGVYSLGPVSWEFNGMKQNLQNPRIEVHPSYDDAALWVGGRVNNNTPFEGEQIRYDLSFGIKMNYQSGPIPLFSSFGQNFWGEYADEKMDWNHKKEGPFLATSKRRAYLAPIKSGALEIPKMAYKYTKQGKPERVVEEKKMGNSYFRSESIQQKPVEDTAYAPAIQLEVKPLPTQGKPADFKGLVGQYSMEVNYDKDSLKVGDALTLTVLLKGNGRPGYIPDPELPDFSEFRLVPPESKVTTKVVQGLQETQKKLTYFLYPRRQLQLEIPPLRLSYFDPKTEKYHTLEQGALFLKVAKGEGVQMAVEKELQGKRKETEKGEALPSTLRPVHPKAKILAKPTSLYKQKEFWIWWGLSLLFYPFVLFLIKKGQARRRDLVGNRRRRAKVSLQKRLSAAKEKLNGGDSKGFYQALEQAMLGYFSDLYNLEFHGRTKVQLEAFLGEQKWGASEIAELMQWIQLFEQRQYSGMGMTTNQEDVAKLEAWLSERGGEQ